MTTGAEYVAKFAEELGIDAPDAAAIEILLDVAGVAAHASERIAAPLTCWLVGQANMSPEDAMKLAQRVAADCTPEPPTPKAGGAPEGGN